MNQLSDKTLRGEGGVSDEELLKTIQSGLGDPDRLASACSAVEKLLDRHRDWLQRLCFYEINNPANAADCLQEVLLEISRGLRNFHGRSEIKTWMFTIARRVVWRLRDKQRKYDQRISDMAQSELGADYGEPASAPNAEAALVVSERSRMIMACVSELSTKQRHVVQLHYFEDLTIEDGAKLMGCSVGTFKIHLFRARKALAVKLQQKGLESD